MEATAGPPAMRSANAAAGPRHRRGNGQHPQRALVQPAPQAVVGGDCVLGVGRFSGIAVPTAGGRAVCHPNRRGEPDLRVVAEPLDLARRFLGVKVHPILFVADKRDRRGNTFAGRSIGDQQRILATGERTEAAGRFGLRGKPGVLVPHPLVEEVGDCREA